jgi:hypothetical protein
LPQIQIKEEMSNRLKTCPNAWQVNRNVALRYKEIIVKNLLVNEAPNLVVIVEGTSLHQELAFLDPASLRQRIQNLIEKLRNSPTVRDSDASSLEETIECLDAAREELVALSDDRLVEIVEKCVGNTMPPEIKKFIEDKRGKALTTIIKASLDC